MLGYCQMGSDVRVDMRGMKFRNALWMYGWERLVVLGGRVMVDEGLLGDVLADVYYFEGGVNAGVHVVLDSARKQYSL